MSSSGVIYAIIVGAWAVYLVPMWLRREDELNRARQTQRYAAAIKVLANKEAFERRWAHQAESEEAEALPRAVGQDFAPSARAPKRSAGTVTGTTSASSKAATSKTATETTASKPATAKRPAVAATTPARPTVTASIADDAPRAARAKTTATRRPSTQTAEVKSPGPRTGLMARRRRVVGLLFTASTLGALVSADLGARFLWAMVAPAVLLSTYIVWLRRDERVRATARAHRRAVAQEAREAREADLQARKEALALREATEIAEAQAEEQLRNQAARRRSAAARARAQAYTQEAPDLRRASNG